MSHALAVNKQNSNIFQNSMRKNSNGTAIGAPASVSGGAATINTTSISTTTMYGGKEQL